jgi:hypothetical protein
MAPRPQIIGQSAHAPDGSDVLERDGPATATQDGGAPAGTVAPAPAPRPDPARPDPTRYGDWERNGRCIDF